MPTYTVHAPPQTAGDMTVHPECFVFVRDGFHFWAFFFAPFWLLAHRLWLALVVYGLINGIIDVSAAMVDAPVWASVLATFLISLLVGFEASPLRRWKLSRRGWKTIGFVVGDNQESAEQRFFVEWVRRVETAPTSPPSAQYTGPIRRAPPLGGDVIGLFPEPEPKR